MFMHALLAQARSTSTTTSDEIPWAAISAVAIALVLFGLLLMIVKRFKRCPSNRVLVIYGKTSGGNAAR
jgi:flotillin